VRCCLRSPLAYLQQGFGCGHYSESAARDRGGRRFSEGSTLGFVTPLLPFIDGLRDLPGAKIRCTVTLRRERRLKLPDSSGYGSHFANANRQLFVRVARPILFRATNATPRSMVDIRITEVGSGTGDELTVEICAEKINPPSAPRLTASM
jgi:hypothetical protein